MTVTSDRLPPKAGFFRRRRRFTEAELELSNLMRLLWEQHITWTRLTITSIVFSLPDAQLVIQRLLRNPIDFAIALEPFYGSAIANEFGRLLREHLTIAAEIVSESKAGNTQAAAEAEKRFYLNADAIAAFLARINPHWSEATWRKMLYDHLALVKAQAVDYLTNDYAAGIALWDEYERGAMLMADELTRGIVMQFPRRFL
jgi:hypothetical protein